jgi:hypothetical protein
VDAGSELDIVGLQRIRGTQGALHYVKREGNLGIDRKVVSF